MQSSERRVCVEDDLRKSGEPLSATALARKYQVSRQVIVGDIALLRAGGVDIQATPRGYRLSRSEKAGYAGTIACKHTPDDMRLEFYTVLDNGGSLIDVIVDHVVYGQLVGQLQIHSRFDADEFIAKIKTEKAQLLSQITDGVHLHTVHCQDEATFGRIVAALDKAGILYQK